MAKRKRDDRVDSASILKHSTKSSEQVRDAKLPKLDSSSPVQVTNPVIQIITGSYERVLHGITASSFPSDNLAKSPTSTSAVKFSDTFLFNAHASAIRCLALSPLPTPESSDSQGVYLATGGSDEKINVFNLSASPPSTSHGLPSLPSLGPNSILENPRNRELGTLLHHSSNITALHFPTRSKLLSASEDNTIAITRLKDLTVVSTVKAPRPKVQGQPSGDTAPPGATPAGVNDFAVHPSLKLMVSVGRGERCMRLWNLVTGKKAGVLNFNRDTLQTIKEGKYSSGEGRKIKWSPDGTEFAVAFERGVVVFGDDSTPKCKVLPSPLTKVHQIMYLTLPAAKGKGKDVTVLAVSTEDGRVLFYDTDGPQPTSNGSSAVDETSSPEARLLGQLGGKSTGIVNRIKDLEILPVTFPAEKTASKTDSLIVVTASSDGTIRLFSLSATDLLKKQKDEKINQVGALIGSYETGNRITCLKAFVMLPKSTEEGNDPEEFEGLDDGGDSQGDSDGDEDDSD